MTRATLMDILKGSVATVALFLAYLSLPLIGVIGGVLAPLPAIVSTFRSGRASGIIIIVLSAAVFAAVVELPFVVFYLLQSATISLLVPLLLPGRRTSQAVVLAAAASIALIAAAGLAIAGFGGISLDAAVSKWITESSTQTSALYARIGFSGEDLKALQQGLQQFIAVFSQAYPALIVITQTTAVMLNVLAFSGIARRRQLPVAIDDFRQFRNPEQLIWLLILAGFAMLVPNQMVERAALNLLLVLLFAYLIQGLAVMLQFFDRMAIPAVGRYFFYFFLVLQPYLVVGVVVLGIFDLWGNFRSPRKQNL
jgi:uncharacterized protein YybS (DUF2232 family)